MATPHNSAEMGQIAETILLPGDPLRAKVIADTFLEDVVQFNSVRNMFGFTGTYKGKKVSVMGTGMGMPSIGIYSHELIHFYGVKNLIRVGSCGACTENVNLGDIIMAQGACTDSNYAHTYQLPGTMSAICDYTLLKNAQEIAEEKGYPYVVGNILSSDLFYTETPEWKQWAKMGVLCIEMESYALYCEAARAGVKALGIFSVSDSVVTGEAMDALQRQNEFRNMMEVALETALRI
ncbi:MAG: purine-nucleoside phosphorylase [Muricoprocola sp.]